MLKGTNSLEIDRFWPLAAQTLGEGPSRHGGLPAQVDPRKCPWVWCRKHLLPVGHSSQCCI